MCFSNIGLFMPSFQRPDNGKSIHRVGRLPQPTWCWWSHSTVLWSHLHWICKKKCTIEQYTNWLIDDAYWLYLFTVTKTLSMIKWITKLNWHCTVIHQTIMPSTLLLVLNISFSIALSNLTAQWVWWFSSA